MDMTPTVNGSSEYEQPIISNGTRAPPQARPGRERGVYLSGKHRFHCFCCLNELGTGFSCPPCCLVSRVKYIVFSCVCPGVCFKLALLY